jgi:peroxiredoxin Q/BCP
MLKQGDPAPDFTLLDQNGEPFHLAEARGHNVLVYFYP